MKKALLLAPLVVAVVVGYRAALAIGRRWDARLDDAFRTIYAG